MVHKKVATIYYDGDYYHAEFNDVTFAGDLTGCDGLFSGTVSANAVNIVGNRHLKGASMGSSYYTSGRTWNTSAGINQWNQWVELAAMTISLDEACYLEVEAGYSVSVHAKGHEIHAYIVLFIDGSATHDGQRQKLAYKQLLSSGTGTTRQFRAIVSRASINHAAGSVNVRAEVRFAKQFHSTYSSSSYNPVIDDSWIKVSRHDR